MKKKLLFLTVLVATLFCVFAIVASAETPSMYIEFSARFDGSNEYVTVYTQNAESSGNPRINFKDYKFYLDVDFTQEVDITTVTGLDFSNAISHNSASPVNRMTMPSAPFAKCTEIKWFSSGFDDIPSNAFNGWTTLTSFDFGGAVTVDYNAFQNTGLVNVVLPSTLTTLKNSVFYNCKSLQTVKGECNLTSLGTSIFQNCTALVSVELAGIAKTSENMFNGCTALTTIDLSKVTNLKEIGKFTFSGCTSLKTIISSGVNQEGAVIIPEGVTWIGQEAFYNCDSIKYLSLPSTITYLGPSICRDSANLQFVDFNENANAINLDNWGHFNNCDALKAMSLPDGIKIISNRFSNYCENLQAVYLPANLEQMNTNGNGQGPFCFDGKMYFVQEPFEVRDADGYFYGDSFQMPTKPKMYFMPSKLATAGGNVSSGTWFRECSGLNTTIVMPTAFTNSTVVQMFRETASASNIKNIVYLGDMESIAWSERNHHINFIFANANDKDISSVTFSSFYNNLNSDSYFYFCSTGYRYTMAAADATAVAATKVENTYCHILNPNKSTIVEPTCITIGYTEGQCFCTAPMNRVETPATGVHIFVTNDCTVSVKCKDDEKCTEMSVANANHALVHTFVYANGFDKTGVYNYYCENAGCTIADKAVHDVEKGAIITFKGYSVPEMAGYYGINAGYRIDTELLSMYEDANEDDVTIGLLMINSADVANVSDILNSDCELVTNVRGFSVTVASLNYSNISIEVKNFQKGESEQGNYYTLSLVTALFIKTSDKIEYLQDTIGDETEQNSVSTSSGKVFNTITANRVYVSKGITE